MPVRTSRWGYIYLYLSTLMYAEAGGVMVWDAMRGHVDMR